MLTKMNAALFNKDVTSNYFTMYGEINDDMAQNFTEWVIGNNFLPAEERPETLTLLVNSEGGSVTSAFAIIDIMRGSSIPIVTVALGQVCSAGLLISMSGEKGLRVITENTSILSHQFGSGSGGKHHELISVAVEYNNIQQRLLNHMSKCTGLSVKDVSEKLMPPSDVWLLPKDAQKLGLCDKVMSLK